MAMVMYLFTRGFVCDNSNVYSTINVHTDSKCITYNNAYTSKHDIGGGDSSVVRGPDS